MIRLLITGNSHVGALKGGWDLIAADYAGKVEVELFAAPGRNIALMERDGTRYGLVDEDAAKHIVRKIEAINGRTTVDLAAYDHVLLVGVSGNGEHAPLARVVQRFDVDGLAERGKPCRLSGSAFDALCDDLVSERVEWSAPWSDLPRGMLSLMPPPRWLETFLEPEVPGPWSGIDLADADIRRILDRYDQRRARAVERLGFRFVTQPAEVLAPSGFTAARFKAGAVRLQNSQEQPEDDFAHMNADYGAIVLRDFLDRLLAGQEETLSA